jgi:pimeloyl-ACP methyl ester carboxylesterase
MPYATNTGVRVYYEEEGSGPPLLLHIGFLGSLDDWRRDDTRYADALRDAYRLILLDPRGQGRSDTPHDPAAYTLDRRVGDVLAVLDAAGIARAHFWGYSMGGRIGFALSAAAPHRVASLVVGGADPYPWEGDPEADDWVRWLRKGMSGFVAEWEREIGPLPAVLRDRWLALDAKALLAARVGSRTGTELAGALSSITAPTLIYYGTADYPDRLPDRVAVAMPDASIVALEGLDHAQAFRRSDLVLPHVRPFLDRAAATPNGGPDA